MRMRHWGWRSFNGRDEDAIEEQLLCGGSACCPRCGGILEARPSTRLAAVLPGDIGGYDLDCRGCRKFYPRVRYSDRSLQLLRLRRFAAAVMRA